MTSTVELFSIGCSDFLLHFTANTSKTKAIKDHQKHGIWVYKLQNEIDQMKSEHFQNLPKHSKL